MKTVRISDISVAYEEAGSGEVLLLVHGFPLDHTMWSAQLESLRDEFHLIAPDLRGFGQTPLTAGGSEDPHAVVTMRRFADDLAELLDALTITAPVALCGLSMGGYIAWQFAQTYRDRLSRLILCDTKAVADTPAAAQQRHKVAESVLRHGSEVVAEAMVMKLLADGTATQFPEMVQQIRAMILGNAPEGIAAAQRGMAVRPDVTDLLPQLDLPALVICGSDDTISPPSEMRAIADALPRARYCEVAAAGHLCPLEQPDQVNEAIRAFMREV